METQTYNQVLSKRQEEQLATMQKLTQMKDQQIALTKVFFLKASVSDCIPVTNGDFYCKRCQYGTTVRDRAEKAFLKRMHKIDCNMKAKTRDDGATIYSVNKARWDEELESARIEKRQATNTDLQKESGGAVAG